MDEINFMYENNKNSHARYAIENEPFPSLMQDQYHETAIYIQ